MVVWDPRHLGCVAPSIGAVHVAYRPYLGTLGLALINQPFIQNLLRWTPSAYRDCQPILSQLALTILFPSTGDSTI